MIEKKSKNQKILLLTIKISSTTSINIHKYNHYFHKKEKFNYYLFKIKMNYLKFNVLAIICYCNSITSYKL